MIYRFTVLFLFLLVPFSTHAQTVGSIIDSLFSASIMGMLVRILISASLLVFLWGVVRMLYGMGLTDTEQAKAREEGKKRIFWGLIGLVVLISVWGIVGLLMNIIGVSQPSSNDHPTPIITW